MKKLHDNLTAEERNLLDGHRERLRKRYLTQSAEYIDDNRMLELLLTYAIPRKDVYLLANSLMQKFGDICGVLDASVDDLMSVDGIGERAAILINMVSAINRRKVISGMSRKHFSSADSVGQELCKLFYGVCDERLLVATFNNSMSMMSYGFVSDGKSGECELDKREFMKYLVKKGVAYVAVAHNHPSGSVNPTSDDLRAMTVIAHEIEGMSLKLVDMFIISGNSYYKMKDAKPFVNKMNETLDDGISYIYENEISDAAYELADVLLNADEK